MKFASNSSILYSSDTHRKVNRSEPLIERCEPRRLMTAAPAPVNFAGEYVAFDNSSVLAVNIRATKNASKYTGDVQTSGVDKRFNATESSSGVLSGKVSVSGKIVAFDATLSGTTLTVSYPSLSSTSDLDQVSTTPAPLPPALASHKHSEFNYKSPGNWKVSQGPDGILLSSSNGTEQVGLFATEADGTYTASQIADSEVAAGGTVLTSNSLANGPVSSTEYKEAGIGLLEYTDNGTPYVSGQIIETLNYSSGQTVALLFEVTAPKAQFAAACPTLLDVLSSVQYNPTAKTGKSMSTPVQSKSKVPGTSGSWSSNPAFAKDEDDYAAAIEEESLAEQEVIDSSVDSLCDSLTE